MKKETINLLGFVKTNLITCKTVMYLLFSLLLILNAAAQEELVVTAYDKVELCPCSNQAYPVYVQNNGDSTSAYSVSFSGNAAKWVQANPFRFNVNPGVAGYFFVNVNSDCGAEGSHNLNVHITTGSLMKTVKQNLSFIGCYKFDTELGNLIEMKEGQESVSFSKHDGAYSICEEEVKVLPILITNKESYGNSYSLSLKGEEWAKLNADEASLDGNARGIALAELKPGKGAEGDYKLNFDVVTKLGNVKTSKEIDVKVEKCYGLKIKLEKEEDIACGEAIYGVKIENDGVSSEEVELSTNFEWAEIKNSTLILEGGEERTVQLALKLNVSGNFDVEVNGFVTNHPDIMTSGKIKVEAATKEECYLALVDLKREITNYYSEEYHNVDVVNSGLKKAHYNVSLDGPSWVGISPDSLQLSPGQKGNLNLHVSPEEDTKADKYKITLKLDSEGVVYSEEVNVKLIQENKIIKNIKSFASYFQYYIYLLVVIAVLVFIFIKPIKKQISKIKKRHGKYKLEREKARQRRKERKEKEEERKLEEERRAEEKQKKQKEEEERKAKEAERKAEEEKKKKEEGAKEEGKKGIKEEKKAEKTAEKKKGKTKKNLGWLWFLFVLVIAGVLFLSVYFKWVNYSALFSKVDLSSFSFISAGLRSVWAYSYYIIIALAFLALSIFFFHTLEKKEKKDPEAKEKKIKEEKKAEKRKKKVKISKIFKPVYFKVSLAAFILLIMGIVIYLYFFEQAKEFFTLYLNYIIMGVIILIILILLMKFYKPIADFLTEEER